jgi:hypothetical protein
MPMVVLVAAAGLTGCKTLTERYIALEVWKYEKCFGHLPPGFVPPGTVPAAAMAPAAPAMRPCGQPSACPPAPCGGEMVGGVSGNCDGCHGGIVEGGLPGGAVVSPGVPAGPGGSPGPSAGLPTPASVTSSRPVVISDEVVLP